ncbi:MAG TPA: class I SAM-dependent methyltransferase [Dehalococcoidales bacterium]
MAVSSQLQKIVYSIFGTNFFIGNQIKTQIKMLATRLPPEFKDRELDDLGCGDGKITLRLKEVFRPRRLRGFDVNPSLIKRARKIGIEAQFGDLDVGLPSGELAVMWGVLHHLKDRENCIKKIKENYSMAFIREPVKNKAIAGLEMGRPLIKEEIESLVKKYLPNARTFYYGHCIFIFYIAPGFNPKTK